MFCGFSKAEFLEEEAPRLEKWLNKNMNGNMQYMENHFDKRLNPTLLVEGAKSVVSLALNYFPKETQKDANAPKISKYAYGEDYHFIIKGNIMITIGYFQLFKTHSVADKPQRHKPMNLSVQHDLPLTDTEAQLTCKNKIHNLVKQ